MDLKNLTWPVDPNYPITQRYGENPGAYSRFGLRGHNGLDIAVPEGTPVMAAEDGIVEKIGNDPGGYGLYVKVLHNDGVETLYGHLSKQLVTQGDNVAGGQAIGKSGNTGNSTGPHLHFEVRMPGQKSNGYGGAVDPLPLLKGQVSAAEPEQLVEASLIGTVRAEAGLNVRSGPGVGHSKTGRLAYGDQVSLVEVWAKTQDGRWVAVYYEGETLLDLE